MTLGSVGGDKGSGGKSEKHYMNKTFCAGDTGEGGLVKQELPGEGFEGGGGGGGKARGGGGGGWSGDEQKKIYEKLLKGRSPFSIYDEEVLAKEKDDL